MTKKFTVSVLIILGLGIVAPVFFINLNSIPEPFLCGDRPCNVILIIPESISARHMGIYGYERDTTPFIDEFFGKEGIVFENAWSAAPWTWPSFAALFTSQLASEVFVETWEDKLCDTIPTFIDVLDKKEIPKFIAHTWTFSPLNKMNSFIKKFRPEESFQGEDALLFIKAVEWVEGRYRRGNGQPFFLFLQPLAPHMPYNPPEPYCYFFDAPSVYPGPIDEEIFKAQEAMDKGEDVGAELRRFRLQYDQEIRYLDSQIESFISRIPEEVRQNTLFIFTSDHGQALGQHINISNIGYRGTLYEEEIHIPFLMKAPGLSHVRIDQPITHLDLGPTILDTFGLEVPETFRGISLLSALQGQELRLSQRIVRAENIHDEPFSYEEWLKVEPKIRTEISLYPRERALRKQNWKLIQRADDSLELYNLEKDYWEQDNLILYLDSLVKEEQVVVFQLLGALDDSLQ